MAFISNGTTVASGGSVTVSSSAVATGTAGISVGAVGSYAFIHSNNNTTTTQGTTFSSGLYYSNAEGQTGNSPSGTWRQMGHRAGSFNNRKTTLMLRIS